MDMILKKVIFAVLIIYLAFVIISCSPGRISEKEFFVQPNIILIMVDDLGYGDLGSYGQKVIKTPHLDNLASKGLKLTQFYSGSPVCAPARSVLMTGYHTGRTTVRGNFGIGGVVGLAGDAGRIPLRAQDITIAEILKDAGYVTGMTGKWGLGEPGTTGLPNDKGFDEWFGYLNQRRAHNHYADYIWLNKEKYMIPENEGGKKEVYTHDLFTQFALDFIDRHADGSKPFFLYVPYLLPHAAYEIPAINPLYMDKDWTHDEKVHASMVSLIDDDVEKIRSLLQEKGIEGKTLLIFTSDNGAALRWDGVFDSSGKLRGRKRDVYEGGIRVPMIISMPGTVPEGRTDNVSIGYFADFMPTFADFAGQELTHKVDGISLMDLFLDKELPEDTNNRILYWEFHEQGGKQAVRMGKWKAVRLDVHEKGFHDEIELYDLETDPYENSNVAVQNPEIVNKMKELMLEHHEPSKAFPFKFEAEKTIN
jgi:arylsulfatase A-like enzyme